MEFHQLRDFVAIASTGSFSQGARKCRVAQPAVSKAIHNLEDELGHRLLDRTSGGVRLTLEGKIFLRGVVRALDVLDQTKRKVTDAHRLESVTLKVGVLPTIYPYFLATPIAQFIQKFPALDIGVIEKPTTTLLKLIISGRLNLAVISPPIPENGFGEELLFKEELLLVLPPKHHLTMQETIEWSDLEHERFILMSEGHCLAEQVRTFFRENNVRLNVTSETSQIETVPSLVMAGSGISLVPRMSRMSGRLPLVYRSLENPKPMRSITVVSRKGRMHSQAATEFLDHLRQTAKTYLETIRPSE